MPNLTPEQFLKGGDFKVLSPEEFLGGGNFTIEGETPPQPGILSRIGNFITGKAQERATGLNAGLEAQKAGKQTPIETGLQFAGQTIGLGTDILGGAIEQGAKAIGAITPGFVKQPFKKAGLAILQSPIGQEAIDALNQGVDAYKSWKANNPRAARDIEAVVNIASVIPIERGGKLAAEEAFKLAPTVEKSIAGTSEKLVTRFTETQLNNLDNFIDKSLSKGIKPSIAGNATATQAKVFKAKARNAVFTILENKNNLQFKNEAGDLINKLPESLQEFSDAIDQTKRTIFSQYNTLTKTAGQEGAKVDLLPISKELKATAKNGVLQDQAPTVAKYAQQRADALTRRGVYTPEQTEEAIKILNQSLEAYYRNPSYESASKAMVDSMVANNLRKGLDTAVEGITGEQYQPLKNQYGALKTIEKDVARRALVDARKNAKGLVDFSDIFSGSQIVNGILSLHPATIASGFTAKAIAKYIKTLNDPNRIIKNMFQKTDAILSRAQRLRIPSPLTGQ